MVKRFWVDKIVSSKTTTSINYCQMVNLFDEMHYLVHYQINRFNFSSNFREFTQNSNLSCTKTSFSSLGVSFLAVLRFAKEMPNNRTEF